MVALWHVRFPLEVNHCIRRIPCSKNGRDRFRALFCFVIGTDVRARVKPDTLVWDQELVKLYNVLNNLAILPVKYHLTRKAFKKHCFLVLIQIKLIKEYLTDGGMLLCARTGLRVVVFTMCVCHVRTLVAFDSLCLIKPYQIVFVIWASLFRENISSGFSPYWNVRVTEHAAEAL